MSDTPIPLLLVETYPTFSLGFERALDAAPEPGYEVTSCDTGERAIQIVDRRETPFAAIFIDLRIESMAARTLIKNLAGRPDDHMLCGIIEGRGHEDLIGPLDDGLDAVISKRVEPANLVELVAKIAAKLPNIYDVHSAALVVAAVKEANGFGRKHGHRLDTREITVLELVAAGHGNETIGERLGISTQGAKSVVRNLYSKLGVNDRASAVSQGYQDGYLVVGTNPASDK